jgi:outer membrane lipase/esterase
MAKLWRSRDGRLRPLVKLAARANASHDITLEADMRRTQVFATAALLLSLGAGAARAQSAPFTSMAAFGDSLSDGGNLSLSLGLPRLRFTTNPGLTAVEGVAQHYGLALEPSVSGGTDFAWGGAGLVDNAPDAPDVPMVPAQVNGFLAAHPQLDPTGLYSIWGGNNDDFFHAAAIAAGTETLAQAIPQMTGAAQVEGTLIDRLQAAGARRLIVFNLPDIGIAPGGSAVDTTLVEAFNAQLNSELAGRRGIVPVNMFALLREAVANPTLYGFANTTTPACTVSPALICTPATLVQPNAGQTFVFADDVHPSAAAHAAVAQAVVAELSAPGQISLLAEAPLALLRGHRAAVREELGREPAGQGWTLFATGRAGERSLDGDWAVADSRSDDTAVTMGGIWRSGEALSAGAALTVGESRVRLAQGLGGFDAKQLAFSAFGQMAWRNGAWASLQAGFGDINYDDIRRSFALGATIRTELSTSHGHDLSVEIAGGQWVQFGGWRTGPFGAFSYDHVHVGDVVESGGDATAMWFAPQNREASVMRIGWALKGAASLGGTAVQPIATVAYGHDFSADRRSVSAGLTTFNGQFDMPGDQPSRNWGEATLGLQADLGHGFAGRLSYEGLFGDRGHENLGVAGVSLSF